MLKKTIEKILCAVVLLSCVLPLSAQDDAYNAFTPYSMFGIGDISKQGTAYNKSMGGVGIATRDKRNINYLNPAAVTAREEKSFMVDFGLAQNNKIYSSKGRTSASNTFNIYDFVISFPIYKSLAMYGGFTPYSDIGYSMKSIITDQSLIGVTGNISTQVLGYGGLSNMFVGAGFEVFKGLSVGAEFQYYFGNLNKANVQSFSNTSYRSIYSGYENNLNASTAKFGIQYEVPLSTTVTATVGATYKLGANLKGTVKDYEYSIISSISDTTRINIDTLSNNPGRVKISSELGVGLSLKGGDKWTAEVNYLRSDWTNSGMDKVPGFASVGNAVFSATASQSVRAGFSLVPNRNDVRYYMKRVTYRGGVYWDQAYYNLDGSSINAFGLTFGATLPVFKWSNGLTIGVDIGQRGNTSGNLIRERYINFNIGLNIFDIWFLKPKYE